MDVKPVINVVGIQCQPEVEEKFNTWYDQTHIPMLLKFRGLRGATRYKILKPSEEYPQYLAIYEFNSQLAFEEYRASPELTAALDKQLETWGGKLDRQQGIWRGEGWVRKWRVQYEAIKTWRK